MADLSVNVVRGHGRSLIMPPNSEPLSRLVTGEALRLSQTISALVTISIELGQDIQAAVDANPNGTAFLLKSGTHRPATAITPKTNNVFLGEAGASISGGRVLTSPTGSNPWVYGGQTQQGTVDTIGGFACEPGHPLCAQPEDVFFDDVPLDAVGSVGAGGAGKFYFDYAANNIYIWDNPSGHVVETSVMPVAFATGSATGVTIRNLIIEKFASPSQVSTITMGASWLLEDCEVRFNHSAAVRNASNSTTRNNYIHHNGAYALVGSGSNILIEDNELSYNNYAFYDPFYGSVTKWVFTEDLIVRGNFSHHNRGNGLWTDISNNNTLYEYNIVEDNWLAGIFHEISYAAIIRYNLINRNGLAQLNPGWITGAGVCINTSSDVEVYGNTLVDNYQGIAALDDDSRPNPPDETHGTWNLHNFNVHDNFVHSTTDLGSGSGYSGILVFAMVTSPFIAGANNHFENNDYWLGPHADYFYWSSGPADETEWVAFGHDETGSFTR